MPPTHSKVLRKEKIDGIIYNVGNFTSINHLDRYTSVCCNISSLDILFQQRQTYTEASAQVGHHRTQTL